MGVINVLDFQVANLIAAGEVVDRPASAVKELLENALDAGATEITVEIKRGGSTFIRVSDNGCGMAREDMPISIRRHATSKIATERDLDGITTLGFRGEALAAISSVSTMRIMSRRKEDAIGTVLTCEGGLITDLSDAGCKVGTTVIVEELFANVPARRKFLKKDSSEAMAVVSIVEKLALSRPDISFKLISDGAVKLQTRGDGKVAGTIYAIMGRDFASKLIEVNSLTDGIEVRGYIGSPVNVRANRNFQNFFLNNRYIKSKTATAALEQAFESYMESEKFPCCVLHIYIHPAFVDVNVHPTKMEVKFSNERLVFDAVYCAVRNALEEATARPEILFEPQHMTPEQHSLYNAFVPVYDRISDAEGKTLTQKQLFDEMPEPISQAPGAPQEPPALDVPAPPPTDADAPPTVSTSTNHLFADEWLQDDPVIHLPFSADIPSKETSPSHTTAPAKETAPTQEPTPTPTAYNPLFEELTFPEADFPLWNLPTPPPAPASPVPSPPPTPPPAPIEPLPDQSIPIVPAHSDGASTDAQPSPSLEVAADQFLFALSAGAKTGQAVSDTSYRILGTAFHAYIFVESNDAVMVIDKHAAHERILFEDMKRIMAEQSGTLQLLLFPLEIALSAEEVAAATEYREEITAAGFSYTLEEASSTLYCTQIPSLLTSDRAADLLVAIIGALAGGTGSAQVTRKSFFEEALYQASCKAAIKAGQIDRDEDMAWVVSRLFENPDILYCPHGRPVALMLKKSRIEHYFKRS